MLRSRTMLAIVTALTLVAIGAVLAAVSSTDSSSGQDSGGYSGSSLPKAVPIEPFSLQDENGRPVTLSALRGRPAILTFLYTSCRDICPLTAQQIRGALDLNGRDIPVVAISVDPKGDTPESVKRWLARQQLDGRITWGLGSESQLQKVWRDYGIAPQTNRSDHSAYVFVLDRDGRRCVSWPVSQLTPEGLQHDLKLIAERNGACQA